MLDDLRYRLRALLRRDDTEEQLDEELRFHYEREIEKQIESGLSRKEAIRRARERFGGLEQVKEECRDARGVRFLENLRQDFHYGLRLLRYAPGFPGVGNQTWTS